MKHFLLFLVLFIWVSNTRAQIKPPVAETDYLSTYFLSPGSVNVLQNDYSQEGDSLAIWIISNVHLGEAYFIDSIIFYTPPNNITHYTSDTIYYIIKDFTTGLYSEEGKVIVSLDRIKSSTLNMNNILARINAVGNQFRKLNYFNLFDPTGGFEAPKGKKIYSIYNSALWLGGLDNGNNLHTACERNRTGQNMYSSSMGFDFWPGPVADSVWYTDDYIMKNNLVWPITRGVIEYHIANFNKPGYSPPASISTWPGNGDTTVGMAKMLAPFIDINNNQVYEPLLGEYPAARGDQAVYFIFNDDYSDHTETLGEKFGIEVHGMAWVYDCPGDSAFYNTVFLKYDIINRSSKNYHDVFLGNYSNLMIGNPGDDFSGSDTLLNSFYAYNADDFDDTTSIYYPGYQHHPPAQGVVFLNRKLNHFMVSQYPSPPWVDTMYYNDPVEAEQYYNYMKSIWRDSTHLTFGGSGYGGNQDCNYIFPGDPLNGTGWTHSNSGNDNVNPHAIGSSGPFTFNSGDTLTQELAYVFARDYDGDNLSSLSLLKQYIEHIKWFYDNDSTPCGTPWSGISNRVISDQKIKVYPNPAMDMLKIDGDISRNADFNIIDISGKEVKSGKISGSGIITINHLPGGFYFLRIKTGSEIITKTFVKH
ncbi:MAG: T9SS type A sorting domain-containing protein [Bacteroidales bacterium]|nr:T9SS type A sorting domain-containing protein [Bacteroidales bacterium]